VLDQFEVVCDLKPNCSQDLVIHVSITIGSWLSSTSSGTSTVRSGGTSLPVVNHLGVELFSSLLGRASSTTSTSSTATGLSSTSSTRSGRLRSGSGFWLSLWLRNALAQTLWWWDFLSTGTVKDQFNLDWLAVDGNTVASRDCLGCVIESVESDVGDAAALSLRSIRKFNSLDGSYGLCEVLLFVQIVVSDRNIVHLTKIAKVISTSGLEGKKESAEKQDPHPLEKSPRKQRASSEH